MPTTRQRLGLGLAATILGLGLAAPPAQARPPEKDPVPFVFFNTDIAKVWFVNSTRAAFCEGADVDGVPIASIRPVRSGAVVGHVNGRGLSVELWQLDEDPTLDDPCADTDDTDEPLAIGSASFRAQGSDLAATGSRADTFSYTGRAALTSVDGIQQHLWWRFHVNDRCHLPETGPPACLVDRVRLSTG